MPETTSSSISLVIPAYNRADLIGETIDSALAQSYPFAKIIVVDDGSTDNTTEVLERYGTLITVIQTPNNGVQAARNTGIRATNTEFVAVCDSDDLLEWNFCQSIVPWIEQHPEIDLCFCNFVNFDTNSVTQDKFSLCPKSFFSGATELDDIFITKVPDLYQRTLSYQPLFPSGLVISRTFFDQIGGYDPQFKGIGAEDWEFTLRAIANGDTALCKLPLVRIRRHPGNDSASSLHMNLGESLILDFALTHHPIASRYRVEMLQTSDERRLRAFDSAFAKGNLALAKNINKQFHKRPFDLKYLIKCLLLSMPTFISARIWKLTQQIPN